MAVSETGIYHIPQMDPNGNLSVENDDESVDSRYTITRSYSDWTYLPNLVMTNIAMV